MVKSSYELEQEVLQLQQRLAASEAACAQMRQCLLAWAAWCDADGDSLTLRDRATEQMDDALALDAGASLLAEREKLLAVAKAAQRAADSTGQCPVCTGWWMDGEQPIHDADCPLAALQPPAGGSNG